MIARLRVPGSALSGLLLGIALVCGAACGGAESQDVLGVLDGAASSSSSGTTGGSSSGTSGSSSGATGSSSGTSGAADAAPDSTASCPSETEPNDNKNTANTIGTTMCGLVDPRNDQDFLTFTLPLTAKSLQITYTGDVVVEVTAVGQTVTLGGDAKVPFVAGARYYILVRGPGKVDSTAWQVNVTEM